MNAPLPREPAVDAGHGSVSGARRGPLWLGTSWKMTKTLAESARYVEELAAVSVPRGVQVFVLPPLTALHTVRAGLPAASPVLVGVQNAHWAPDGPVTGEVSMHQVRDAGAQIVEIGHSDRRLQFGETDEVVAAKVAAALDEHLVPLLCVGEPGSARATPDAVEHVGAQVRAGLAGIAPADLSRVLVAYEPVWAIGAGAQAATPDHVDAVLHHLRAVVADLAPGASPLGLLYGGSVSTENARVLLGLDDVDGLFVGRAAWTADGLTDLMTVYEDVLADQVQAPPTVTSEPASPTPSTRPTRTASEEPHP